MKFLNSLLYQTHRWVGIVLAIFMLFWLLTGIVIIYSTPTTQNRSQQLAHAESLQPDANWLSLGQVWDASAEQRKASDAKRKTADVLANNHGHQENHQANHNQVIGINTARLVRSGNEPLWLIEDTRGQRFAVSALNGALREINVEQALAIAQNWFKTSDSGALIKANYLETVESPIILRNQDALRPFHRIAVGDDGIELLISSHTGEVLHASTRVERAFYWAGNWLHTFKPLDSIGLADVRHDIQTWLGLFATLATLTGMIIGWLRWRPGFAGKPTYSQGRTQPYRDFWFKWHFWSGLIGGTVLLSWALSGFLETNPAQLFSQANANREELSRYFGSELPEIMRSWQPTPAIKANTSDVVELNWQHLGNEAVLLAYSRNGQRLPLPLDGVATRFSDASLTAAIQRLAGNTKISNQQLLDDYDSYYYPRHHQSLVEKPLPVVLVELDDEARTRFYLDPQDGRLLTKLDQSRRVYRWLYSGLHHWDFGWLYYRPLWDAWMLTWVTFGLALASTSVVIGWQRLKKTFIPKKRAVSARTSTAGK
jgi:uncharacterized iron-regulated membrane protein